MASYSSSTNLMSSSVINRQYYSSLNPSLEEGEEEANHDRQDHEPKLIPFFPSYEDHDQIQTSSFQYPTSYHPSQEQQFCRRQHDQEIMVDDGGRSDGDYSLLLRISMASPESNFKSTTTYKEHTSHDDHKSSITNTCTPSKSNKTRASKWMSSKMRLMRKMMMNSQPQEKILQEQTTTRDDDLHNIHNINSYASSNNNGGSVVIRVCSDCKTTKTPLWRSGPQGPKSLCNACGIRQRKARKAAAMATNATMTTSKKGISATTDHHEHNHPCSKEKESDSSCIINDSIPYKKRSQRDDDYDDHAETREDVSKLDNISVSLKKKNKKNVSAFQPQDKEAAILLMALSCDLIYG